MTCARMNCHNAAVGTDRNGKPVCLDHLGAMQRQGER